MVYPSFAGCRVYVGVATHLDVAGCCWPAHIVHRRWWRQRWCRSKKEVLTCHPENGQVFIEWRYGREREGGKSYAFHSVR